MKEESPKEPHNIFLDSNIMRCPQVFWQFGANVENIARDLVIWMAWNGSKDAQLNVKQFADMFGYSRPFLMKPVNDFQKDWLKKRRFGAGFKDQIGFALAALSVERLNFPSAALYKEKIDEKHIETHSFINIIGDKVTATTTRRGTSYHFTVDRRFLDNSAGLYTEFDLNEYLQVRDAKGRAWTAGRKMWMHMVWKRREWERAKDPEHERHQASRYDELLVVSGIVRKATEATSAGTAATRAAFELRDLLEAVCKFPQVALLPELSVNYDTGVYEPKFTKYKETTKRRKTAG